MALSRGFAEQLARPHGLAGRLLGGAMDLANRKPTRLAIDLLAPRPGESVLDAGCGTGAAMTEVLRRAPCKVIGIDPSGEMVRVARKRLWRLWRGADYSLYQSSIEDMPFADESFDAVLALNVLYFCDAEAHMVSRLANALKPGGRLVAYVTHRDTMRHWAFAREGIHRLFNGDSLRSLLLAGGFASERIQVHETRITRSVLGLLACAER